MGGFFKTDVVRGKKEEVFLGAMEGRLRDYRQRRRQNQTSIKPRGLAPLSIFIFGTAVLRHCGNGFHGHMAQVDFFTRSMQGGWCPFLTDLSFHSLMNRIGFASLLALGV